MEHDSADTKVQMYKMCYDRTMIESLKTVQCTIPYN